VSRKSPHGTCSLYHPSFPRACYRVQPYIRQVRKRWKRKERERGTHVISISTRLSAASRSRLVLCHCGPIVNSSRIGSSLARRKRERDRAFLRGNEVPRLFRQPPSDSPSSSSSSTASAVARHPTRRILACSLPWMPLFRSGTTNFTCGGPRRQARGRGDA